MSAQQALSVSHSKDEPITDFIREICERFGPRLPGTAAEAKTASFIAETLRKFCDEVAVEEHRFSPKSLDWNITVFLAGYLGALMAYAYVPLAGATLIAAVLAIFLLARLRGYEILEHLYPHETTRNVVGKVKAKGNPKKILIFSGHHDSAYYTPLFEKPYIRLFAPTVLFILGSHFALFLANITKLGNEWLGLRWLIIPSWILFAVSLLGGMVFVAFRLLLFRNIAVMGANDNLSGVAVAVAVAEHFAANRPEHTEVWAVSFGAEEAGLCGSKRFARKHHGELSSAFLVNLEMVGAGAMIAVAGERSAGAKHSPEVVSLIVEAARQCGITIPAIVAPFGETDAASFSRSGLRAATIATFDEDGVPPKWHVLGDTLENVNEARLRDALNVCVECVHTLEHMAPLPNTGNSKND